MGLRRHRGLKIRKLLDDGVGRGAQPVVQDGNFRARVAGILQNLEKFLVGALVTVRRFDDAGHLFGRLGALEVLFEAAGQHDDVGDQFRDLLGVFLVPVQQEILFVAPHLRFPGNHLLHLVELVAQVIAFGVDIAGLAFQAVGLFLLRRTDALGQFKGAVGHLNHRGQRLRLDLLQIAVFDESATVTVDRLEHAVQHFTFGIGGELLPDPRAAPRDILDSRQDGLRIGGILQELEVLLGGPGLQQVGNK